ncbi:MAG: hypothetical protein ABIL68_09530 [bacterium]
MTQKIFYNTLVENRKSQFLEYVEHQEVIGGFPLKDCLPAAGMAGMTGGMVSFLSRLSLFCYKREVGIIRNPGAVE